MASTSPPKVRSWVQPLRIALVAILSQIAGSETIHNAAARVPAVAVTLAVVEILVAVLPVSVTSESVGKEAP